jgi:hypothetical protein
MSEYPLTHKTKISNCFKILSFRCGEYEECHMTLVRTDVSEEHIVSVIGEIRIV